MVAVVTGVEMKGKHLKYQAQRKKEQCINH
jgi:hypothetical protein